MARRLPIFFLLDCSESMAGEELYKLDEAIRAILSELMKDPKCIESIWIEFIAFAGKARKLNSLTELTMTTVPELPIGGGTGLGNALKLLMNEIDTQVKIASDIEQGDWKPIVFLLTDGIPTDSPETIIQLWQHAYRPRTEMIAVSMGNGADQTVLSEIADTVVIYDDSSAQSMTDFVRWMSQSIQALSTSIQAGTGAKLANFSEGAAVSPAVNLPGKYMDPRYAVLIGRCEQKKHPYLVKFRRDPDFIAGLDLPGELANAEYILSDCIQLRESFFDLCDGNHSGTIAVSKILGQPDCPHCGTAFSIAVHGECGNVHCVRGDGSHICPWCGSPADYGSTEDFEDFEIRRGQG